MKLDSVPRNSRVWSRLPLNFRFSLQWSRIFSALVTRQSTAEIRLETTTRGFPPERTNATCAAPLLVQSTFHHNSVAPHMIS